MTEVPGAFTLRRARPLPVLGGTFREYVHATGARLLHVDVPDPSCTLSLSFRTPAWSDAGHAHVLEHLVLMGSRRWPSRQAFQEWQRWLMLDYLNASTTRDWTAFTASSTQQGDVLAALDFLLDAAFSPLLSAGAFRQEAWRAAPDGTLGGVILNEMKGALAHPGRRLREAAGAALFPGTPYAFQAGGTPQALPDLSVEEVRAYHARYYVPANLTVFAYGALPLDDLTRRLESALYDLPPGQPAPLPRPVTRGLAELALTHPTGAQTLLAWALPPETTALEMQALNVLALALLGHPEAPLCRAVRALGGELADGSGLHADTAQPMFAVGVQATADPQELRRAVLAYVARPLPAEEVQAALGRYALGALDTQHNGFPYGVQLSFDVLGAAHHGHDPLPWTLAGSVDRLRALPDLRRELADLARRFVTDNPHHTVLRLETAPDPLPRTLPGGTPEAPAEEEEAVGAPLPRPVRARPPLRATVPALARAEVAGVTLQAARVRGALTQFSLSREVQWPDGHAAWLPAYLQMLPRSPLGQALTSRLRALGAQWSVNADTTHDPRDPARVGVSVTLNVRALSAHRREVVGVLADTWLRLDPAPDSADSLLRERVTRLRAGLVQNAPQFAMLREAGRVNPAFVWRDRFDGLRSHELLEAAAGHPALAPALRTSHQALWGRPGLRAVIVADAPEPDLLDLLLPLLDALGPSSPPAVVLDAPVACPALPDTAAWAWPTVPFASPDAAAFTLLARLLQDALHGPVRAQGGAYGVTVRTLPEAGVLLAVSARDPSPERTRALFREAPGGLPRLTDDLLEAARLGALRQTLPLRSDAMLARQAALDEHSGFAGFRAAYLDGLLTCRAGDVERAAQLLAGEGAACAPPPVVPEPRRGVDA